MPGDRVADLEALGVQARVVDFERSSRWDGLRQFRDLMCQRDPRHPAQVTARYVTRRGLWAARRRSAAAVPGIAPSAWPPIMSSYDLGLVQK